MGFSNFSDLVKYMADGDLLNDKYGDHIAIKEFGQARFTSVSRTTLTGTLTTAAQPNITSVGTLGSLAITNGITARGAKLNIDGLRIDNNGGRTWPCFLGALSHFF